MSKNKYSLVDIITYTANGILSFVTLLLYAECLTVSKFKHNIDTGIDIQIYTNLRVRNERT